MKKWGLGAFGLAAVVGVIALGASVLGGVAQAQEPPGEGSSFQEQYQEALAEKLGVSVDELQAAQEAARSQMIDDAVASGRMSIVVKIALLPPSLPSLRRIRSPVPPPSSWSTLSTADLPGSFRARCQAASLLAADVP